MDLAKVKQLRHDIEIVLKAVEAKHGVKFDLGNIKYGRTHFSTKIECTELDQNGSTEATSKEWQALLTHGKRLIDVNFRPECVYLDNRLGLITFVGYKSKNYRYPFVVKDVEGKRFKISKERAINLVTKENT